MRQGSRGRRVSPGALSTAWCSTTLSRNLRGAHGDTGSNVATSNAWCSQRPWTPSPVRPRTWQGERAPLRDHGARTRAGVWRLRGYLHVAEHSTPQQRRPRRRLEGDAVNPGLPFALVGEIRSFRKRKASVVSGQPHRQRRQQHQVGEDDGGRPHVQAAQGFFVGIVIGLTASRPLLYRLARLRLWRPVPPPEIGICLHEGATATKKPGANNDNHHHNHNNETASLPSKTHHLKQRTHPLGREQLPAEHGSEALRRRPRLLATSRSATMLPGLNWRRELPTWLPLHHSRLWKISLPACPTCSGAGGLSSSLPMPPMSSSPTLDRDRPKFAA